MSKLRIKDLIESFEKAIIIDIKNEKVYSIKNGGIKCYPKEHYNEILSGLNYMDFSDDE